MKAAYRDGETLLREFNRFVNNINDNQDAPVDIPAARADYGLGRVLTSDLTHPFVKATLTRIQRVAATTPPPVVLPRESVLTRIAAILAVIESQGVSAGIGDRSSLTGEKLAAQDALEEAVARVRLVLQGTLPLMFRDPLLHNYGFVPRQEPESEDAKAPTVAVGAAMV